jgi:hypothetical protein
VVCTELTIGSESFCTHPMKLLGDVGLVESHFGLFGDNISVSARQVHGLCQSTIGLEIVLDAPDGTPRR